MNTLSLPPSSIVAKIEARVAAMLAAPSLSMAPRLYALHREGRPELPRPVRQDASGWRDEDDALRKAIKVDLRAAGSTLKRMLPPPELAQLYGRLAAWPQIVHDVTEHALYTPRRSKPARPSPREIDDLDRVLVWFLWLVGDQRVIVSAWSLGNSFRAIARVDPKGRCWQRIYQMYDAGITQLVLRLASQRP